MEPPVHARYKSYILLNHIYYYEDSVLEAKCPYTERNTTIEEAVNTSSNFCLKKTENGQYALKEEHVYWHQVQGEIIFHAGNFAISLSGHLKVCNELITTTNGN